MDIVFWHSVMKAVLAFAPYKVVLVVIGVIIWSIATIYCVSLVGVPFFERINYERDKLIEARSNIIDKTQKLAESSGIQVTNNSTNTGNVNVTGNSGATQVNIGSPGSTQVINQHRKINPQAKIEKLQRDGNFVIRLILNQTSGIWDQGVLFQFEVKLTGPYKSAHIVQGLPPALTDVKIGENRETGYYSFSTITAPYADRPIIFEATAAQDINVERFAVAPIVGQ
ncbi:MAG: hypothetical protein KGJ06_02235 [Pseudomonadota bacterium]|nr:hypothetical protein [Pseudomonadota bacterium]